MLRLEAAAPRLGELGARPGRVVEVLGLERHRVREALPEALERRGRVDGAARVAARAALARGVGRRRQRRVARVARDEVGQEPRRAERGVVVAAAERGVDGARGPGPRGVAVRRLQGRQAREQCLVLVERAVAVAGGGEERREDRGAVDAERRRGVDGADGEAPVPRVDERPGRYRPVVRELSALADEERAVDGLGPAVARAVAPPQVVERSPEHVVARGRVGRGEAEGDGRVERRRRAVVAVAGAGEEVRRDRGGRRRGVRDDRRERVPVAKRAVEPQGAAAGLAGDVARRRQARVVRAAAALARLAVGALRARQRPPERRAPRELRVDGGPARGGAEGARPGLEEVGDVRGQLRRDGLVDVRREEAAARVRREDGRHEAAERVFRPEPRGFGLRSRRRRPEQGRHQRRAHAQALAAAPLRALGRALVVVVVVVHAVAGVPRARVVEGRGGEGEGVAAALVGPVQDARRVQEALAQERAQRVQRRDGVAAEERGRP